MLHNVIYLISLSLQGISRFCFPYSWSYLQHSGEHHCDTFSYYLGICSRCDISVLIMCIHFWVNWWSCALWEPPEPSLSWPPPSPEPEGTSSVIFTHRTREAFPACKQRHHLLLGWPRGSGQPHPTLWAPGAAPAWTRRPPSLALAVLSALEAGVWWVQSCYLYTVGAQ